MVKRTANGICTIPTAATSCQSACKNYSKALFEIHSRKLTWIPKWWFGKGNFLYKWQFLVSMLDFWGVLTSFAFKEWTGTLWFCRGCLIWMMLFHNSEISEDFEVWQLPSWPFCVQRIVGPSDYQTLIFGVGGLTKKPLQVVGRLRPLVLAGFFFFGKVLNPTLSGKKTSATSKKKKSEVMHVVIWYICMCYIYTDLYTHTVHI